MKYFRCPVLNQIPAKGIVDEVRAFVAAHRPNDPATLKWINDRDRCDEQAEFVRFLCEEYAVPRGKTLDQMPRTGKGYIRPVAVQRNMIVRCPIHGEQIRQHMGNHISVKQTTR